ncbi:hypothetical protein K490DRAFT_71853 [Saccharata proteae CBS 121410]|uniref:HD domain-containing protein n=1 Tax=Saccharata proteae CBS 121410 TaxID=1314787 RepID=A0A9P4LX45_9PEZI|nr:hypothetical protein K490DRAFT_71853 [Saccharata proteae CBS 121410]
MTTPQVALGLANIAIPMTPIVNKALDFARRHSTPYAYNHIQRSLFFGFLIASKLPHLRSRDQEVHAVAAILHDLGWDPTGALVSRDKRFEVDGADAARDFLRREAPDWDSHRLQLVWDAIALHTIGSVVFYKEAEVQACAYGIWADFQGPERVPGGLLTWEEYDRVVDLLPRLGLMEGLKSVMCGLCRSKPETTYDNTVGEWGDKFVEGYRREGKLTADLLLTCDLDSREVKVKREDVL